MRYAVIDMGSNTIRLYIYELVDNNLKLLIKKDTTAGLASYIENGYMSEKGINKAVKICSSFYDMALKISSDKIYVFATASIRNTLNAEEVIDELNKRIGVRVELISGEEEAEYGFIGVRSDYSFAEGVQVDIGGGSSEILLFENERPYQITSLAEGSLSMYVKHVSDIFPNEDEMKSVEEKISAMIRDAFEIKKSYRIATVTGGTIRAAGNIIQELKKKNTNKEISVEELRELIDLIIRKDKKLLKTILQVAPSRLHTISTGVVILLEICDFFRVEKIYISDKGVREGYLTSKLSQNMLNVL